MSQTDTLTADSEGPELDCGLLLLLLVVESPCNALEVDALGPAPHEGNPPELEPMAQRIGREVDDGEEVVEVLPRYALPHGADAVEGPHDVAGVQGSRRGGQGAAQQLQQSQPPIFPYAVVKADRKQQLSCQRTKSNGGSVARFSPRSYSRKEAM